MSLLGTPGMMEWEQYLGYSSGAALGSAGQWVSLVCPWGAAQHQVLV